MNLAEHATVADAASCATGMPEIVWITSHHLPPGSCAHESGGWSVACAQLDVGARLEQFDGHFPGAPLLPGVALVDWAITLGRMRFELPAHFLRLEALKFRRPVLPGTTLSLDLRWHEVRSELAVEYASEHGVHAQARLIFGDAHA